MPWSTRDAYSHTKKANTPEMQNKWAKIANEALSQGKDEASAIKIANAAVADSPRRPQKPVRKPVPNKPNAPSSNTTTSPASPSASTATTPTESSSPKTAPSD